MRTQIISMAVAALTMFPIAANAQAFGNININLNDVMVGQRMQDMSRQLSNANDSMSIAPKAHRKHEKKNKNHRLAVLHDVNDATPAVDSVPAAVEVQTN